jgi:hypothetical protein
MPSYLVSGQVAYEKNHLRPLILFLIEKRQSVVGDSDFNFSIDEYTKFIKRQYKYPLYIPNSSVVKDSLDLLKKFKRRNGSLKITISEKKLLNYKKTGNNFTISSCFGEYLTNTLRFIECSIKLDKNGLPLEKDESFFGLDQQHRITFMGEPSHFNLGKKEEAIFNYLRKFFNEECSYIQLFEAVLIYKKDDPRVGKILDKERAGYIGDGIDEIREKLYKVSGYRLAIETIGGRASVFKLIY